MMLLSSSHCLWLLPLILLIYTVQCFQLHPLPIMSRTAVSSSRHQPHSSSNSADDKELLEQVSVETLLSLCEQYHVDLDDKEIRISTESSSSSIINKDTYTKEYLLQRLRNHATEKSVAAQEIYNRRVDKIHSSTSSRNANSKERFEVVGGRSDDDAGDDPATFYFEAPDGEIDVPVEKVVRTKQSKTKTVSKRYLDNSDILTPPPPANLEPDENGERSVTTYSSTDINDLTAAVGSSAMGGGNSIVDSLSNVPDNPPQPWDHQPKTSSSDAEIDLAKKVVTDFVANVLADTNLPGFRGDKEDDADKDANVYGGDGGIPYMPFNPTTITSETMSVVSKSLRTGRGSVLDEILHEFEMRAIGYDGRHGDDVVKGGGHYREASKIRAYLEGYRLTNVKQRSQATVVLLLDKLILGGYESLDDTLATMVRNSDDTGNDGELTDSLIEYLNDSIRMQELKVEKIVEKRKQVEKAITYTDLLSIDEDKENNKDAVDSLWNVTVDEDGKRIESIDPNDPIVQKALRDEAARLGSSTAATITSDIPISSTEQLLLVLQKLRDRIQTEAMYGSPGESSNLKILAYLLKTPSYALRRQLLLKYNMISSTGTVTNMDRLDSFEELVRSSMEYAQSTNYELQPRSTNTILNVPQLQAILNLITELRGDPSSSSGTSLLP